MIATAPIGTGDKYNYYMIFQISLLYIHLYIYLKISHWVGNPGPQKTFSIDNNCSHVSEVFVLSFVREHKNYKL